MIVHVLLEENDKGTYCLGVYKDYNKAKQDKYDIIRDQYHIPEDEVSDEDLDDEIYPSGATYTIIQREVI
jgi:hypothetical protein